MPPLGVSVGNGSKKPKLQNLLVVGVDDPVLLESGQAEKDGMDRGEARDSRKKLPSKGILTRI